MEEVGTYEDFVANLSSVYLISTFQDPNDDTEIETEGDDGDETILGPDDIQTEFSIINDQNDRSEIQLDTDSHWLNESIMCIPEEDFPCPDEIIVEFVRRPCCLKECHKKFSKDLSMLRLECAELDYYENGCNILNGIILGIIRTAFDSQSHSSHARVRFQVQSIEVCREMFLFCHNIKIKRFKQILRTYKQSGLTLKRHGNCGRLPPNAKSFTQYQTVANFIKNYAEDHALFMPGRLDPQYKLCKLLPSSETKAVIYEKYKVAIQNSDTDEPPVSFGLFKYIWRTCCPDIIICQPRSDLCATCQRNYTSQLTMMGKSEEEKIAVAETQGAHLEKVQRERGYYNEVMKSSREKFAECKLDSSFRGTMPPLSYDDTIHISYDFAQGVHIPSNPMQPGPIYFLTPYKVGLFGIMNNTDNSQCTYVIPETVDISKGKFFHTNCFLQM